MGVASGSVFPAGGSAPAEPLVVDAERQVDADHDHVEDIEINHVVHAAGDLVQDARGVAEQDNDQEGDAFAFGPAALE